MHASVFLHQLCVQIVGEQSLTRASTFQLLFLISRSYAACSFWLLSLLVSLADRGWMRYKVLVLDVLWCQPWKYAPSWIWATCLIQWQVALLSPIHLQIQADTCCVEKKDTVAFSYTYISENNEIGHLTNKGRLLPSGCRWVYSMNPVSLWRVFFLLALLLWLVYTQHFIDCRTWSKDFPPTSIFTYPASYYVMLPLWERSKIWLWGLRPLAGII